MGSSTIHITGKQVDVVQRLREHIHEMLDHLMSKYHLEPLEIHVVFEQRTQGVMSRIHVKLPHTVQVHGEGIGDNPYAAFDDMAHHIESRIRRYKKRLTDHHKSRDVSHAATEALSYILAPEEHEEEDAQADTPVIIAEMRTEIPVLTVSEAVMRMDLEAAHVFVFRNKSHGHLNVVYRRSDQNIGWIDPGLTSAHL